MPEIEFSVIRTSDSQIDFLRRRLVDFQAATNIRVHLKVQEWQNARDELVKVGLHRSGIDVSEIGSTWIGDMVGMNALRPYTLREVEALGGELSFFPGAWQSSITPVDSQVWAIPWVISGILVVYRRDILQQANIPETQAFSSFDQIEHTLEELQRVTSLSPLALPVKYSRYSTLHNVVSWVWGAGGDLLSPDGKCLLLNQPVAIQAIARYFKLRRFLRFDMSPDGERQMNLSHIFWKGRAAMAIGGSWLAGQSESISPEVKDNLGLAPMPGPAFVGAQSLVLWGHSRNQPASFELIKFLSQPAFQQEYASLLNLSPAHIMPENSRYDPLGNAMSLAARQGRSFPPIRLLGLMEDRLSGAMEQVWETVLADDQCNIDEIVNDTVESLVQRLNLTLGG